MTGVKIAAFELGRLGLIEAHGFEIESLESRFAFGETAAPDTLALSELDDQIGAVLCRCSEGDLVQRDLSDRNSWLHSRTGPAIVETFETSF